jgi:hypothetical protein
VVLTDPEIGVNYSMGWEVFLFLFYGPLRMSLYPVKELFDMSVLGILTCEILELEFAHLLRVDKQLARITVLAHERSAWLLRALHLINSQKD